MVTGAEVRPDPHTKHEARFYVEQISNALAPSNFALTNPEVLKLTLATNGENLVEGMENLARDIAAGGGQLRIRQTDFGAFEVGSNLATTPGKVIFQNELMQLLQYAPATDMVYRRPCSSSALDQQVLHIGPESPQILHQMGSRAGLHRLRPVMGQPA